MSRLGILAYGSLIDDPGNDILELIIDRKETITPFPVEFARTSSSRDGAPTIIPFESGIPVKAQILILKPETSIQLAMDILYKRETRKKDVSYKRPNAINNNSVLVEQVENYENVQTVLYTKIGSNINGLTPEILASSVIRSAEREAGAKGLDGISYLISAKRNGIKTKLSEEYENCILSLTKTNSLQGAYLKCRNK